MARATVAILILVSSGVAIAYALFAAYVTVSVAMNTHNGTSELFAHVFLGGGTMIACIGSLHMANRYRTKMEPRWLGWHFALLATAFITGPLWLISLGPQYSG
jgi:hypothetical protein